MTNLKKEIIENGIHYTLHGDYYLPIWISLKVPDNPSATTAGCGKLTWKSIVPAYTLV